MKKLLLMLSVITLSACSQNTNPPLEFNLPNTTFTQPIESIMPPTASTKVQLLDLRNANVTYMTQEVGTDSVNAVLADMEKFNNKNNNPIYLILDTPGGSVIEGARLITAMQTSKNPVYGIDTGLAASMGFMILEHAAKRLAVPKAILMAHPASIGMGFQGELDKAVSRLAFLKRFVDKMDRYVAIRAGVTYEAFKLKTSSEYWLDSEDALAANYLDAIVAIKLPSSTTFGLGNNKLRNSLDME